MKSMNQGSQSSNNHSTLSMQNRAVTSSGQRNQSSGVQQQSSSGNNVISQYNNFMRSVANNQSSKNSGINWELQAKHIPKVWYTTSKTVWIWLDHSIKVWMEVLLIKVSRHRASPAVWQMHPVELIIIVSWAITAARTMCIRRRRKILCLMLGIWMALIWLCIMLQAVCIGLLGLKELHRKARPATMLMRSTTQ